MAVSLFKDGQGNQIGAIQWDGTDPVAVEIAAFSNGQAGRDRRGVMGYIDETAGTTRKNVGLNDWICLDKDRHIFALTNQQITSSYTAVTP